MTLPDFLFFALVGLTFADLATTLEAGDRGLSEGNWFLAKLIGKFGWNAVLFPAKWAIIGYVGMLNANGEIGWQGLAAIDALYLAVVGNNVAQLRKTKGR